MRLALGAGHAGLEDSLAAPRDRVAVAEGGDEGLVEGLQRLPGGLVLGDGGMFGRHRHQLGKLPRALLVGLIGEGGVVAGDLLGAEFAARATVEQQADRHLRDGLADGQPILETFRQTRARGQAGVGHGHRREPLGEGGHQAQADQAAPVLAEQHDAGQVQGLEPDTHPFHMPLIGVVRARRRLVGAPKADQVRRDATVAPRHQARDDVAVEIGPGGLAMQQQHRRTVARPLVHIVQPQRPLGVDDVQVLGGIGPVGQSLEPVVRRPEDLHGALLIDSDA